MFPVNFHKHAQPSEIFHLSLRHLLGLPCSFHPFFPLDSPWRPLLPHNAPPNSHIFSCNLFSNALPFIQLKLLSQLAVVPVTSSLNQYLSPNFVPHFNAAEPFMHPETLFCLLPGPVLVTLLGLLCHHELDISLVSRQVSPGCPSPLLPDKSLSEA